MLRNSCRMAMILLATMTASAAFAQVNNTVRIKGAITAVDAQSVTIAAADGHADKITFGANLQVGTIDKATLVDIKQGDYIGSAARENRGGTLRAIEVHSFAPSQRGVGEGYNPNFTPIPNSSMPNAAVSSSVDGVDGRKLTLTYKGGEKQLLIATNTVIVRFGVGSPSDLKVGAQASATADKQADGSLQASRFQVGINGTALPF